MNAERSVAGGVFDGGSGVTTGGAGAGGCSTGGAIVTGDDGDVSGGGVVGGGAGARTGGLRTGGARRGGGGCGGVGSAATAGGRDSGTSVDGPCSCAVSGAETSSPGDTASLASSLRFGSRCHNAAMCTSSDSTNASQRTGIVMTSCRERLSLRQSFIRFSIPAARPVDAG